MQRRTIEASSGDAILPHLAPAGREADGEISLARLYGVVRKRWRWLLSGLLAGIFGAIVYVVVAVPAYESRASIQIGKVHGFGLIEDIDALVFQLMDQYGPESGDDGQREMPYLKQVTKVPAQKNILRLVAVGGSPEQARGYLIQTVSKVMREHEEIYGGAIDPLRYRLAAVDGRSALLSTQITELGKLVARLNESQPLQASLTLIERGRLYAELNELERERSALKQQVSKPYSNMTHEVVRPVLPVGPAAPRKAVALGIGIALGLMLGILSAFFRESFENARGVT